MLTGVVLPGSGTLETHPLVVVGPAPAEAKVGTARALAASAEPTAVVRSRREGMGVVFGGNARKSFLRERTLHSD